MATFFFWILTALAGGVAFSTRFVPTEEDLRTTFEEAQRLYAAGDYEQAIEKYTAIAQTQSTLLNVETVEVTIGEITSSIGDVALYQSGNAYLKMAEEALRRADRSEDEKEAEKWIGSEIEKLGGRRGITQDAGISTEPPRDELVSDPGLRTNDP